MPNATLRTETVFDWRGGTIPDPLSVTFERKEGYFVDVTIAGNTVRLDAGFLKNLAAELGEVMH